MSASALSPKPDDVPGIGSMWRHMKGDLYTVVAAGRHSEDPDEWLITYRPFLHDGDDWVRSLRLTEKNQWPGWHDNRELGLERFAYVSGPRTWRDEG